MSNYTENNQDNNTETEVYDEPLSDKPKKDFEGASNYVVNNISNVLSMLNKGLDKLSPTNTGADGEKVTNKLKLIGIIGISILCGIVIMALILGGLYWYFKV